MSGKNSKECAICKRPKTALTREIPIWETQLGSV
ncbi:hypothetical protein NPIL_342381, partial [Nephila pilipes]